MSSKKLLDEHTKNVFRIIEGHAEEALQNINGFNFKDAKHEIETILHHLEIYKKSHNYSQTRKTQESNNLPTNGDSCYHIEQDPSYMQHFGKGQKR